MERLRSQIDHVAVAVPERVVAERRWRDQLGGRALGSGDDGVFASHQLRYAGEGKLELLTPSPRADPAAPSFIRAFLHRHGSRVHHVTLKVPDLLEAVALLGRAGLGAVDVRTDNPWWHEAFLRPSQVGGLVVQVAASARSDAEWLAAGGQVAEEVPADAATLLGPTLRDPDLDAAARRWELLGAEVERSGDALTCRWRNAPLDVVIAAGPAPAGPVGLRMSGTPGLPADPDLGAAVLPV